MRKPNAGCQAELAPLPAGEENVAMVDDKFYPSEQILVHEFGHTVMDVGLPASQREAILAAHRAAMKQQLYDADCYMARCVNCCMALAWVCCRACCHISSA